MPISSCSALRTSCGALAVVLLALAVSFCGSSPTPCLRNSDCTSSEYCAAGACLVKQTGDGSVLVYDASISTGAGGTGGTTVVTTGVGGAAAEASTVLSDADASIDADAPSN